MNKLIGLGTLIASLLVLTTVAQAASPPALIPVQGYLTDSEGAPVDDKVTIRFRLYTGAQPKADNFIYTEELEIEVQDGHFTVYLGDGKSEKLDLAAFADHPTLYVGVRVEGEASDMLPLLQLATAPYAAHAQSCETLQGQTAEELMSSVDAREDLEAKGHLDGEDDADLLTREQADKRFSRLSQCYWIANTCAGIEDLCAATCRAGDVVISGGCNATYGSTVSQDPGVIVEDFPGPSSGDYKGTTGEEGWRVGDPSGPVIDSWICRVKDGYRIDSAYAFCCPGA